MEGSLRKVQRLLGKKGGIIKQPTPIFNAFVDDKGKMKMLPYVRESMLRWISTLRGEIDFTIKKHRKNRTVDQNSYYWGVVLPILAEYFGHDNPDNMHTDLKRKFNPVESKINPGEIIGGSTTKLSTVEFMAADDSYVERICRWAAMEYEIYIPPPKKVEKEDG